METNILGWSYEVGLHCTACAEERFGESLPIPIFVSDNIVQQKQKCDSCHEEMLNTRQKIDQRFYELYRDLKELIKDKPDKKEQRFYIAHYFFEYAELFSGIHR